MNDLVKEIDYRLKDLERVRQLHYNTIGGAETVITCEKAELTLQRAREALRWIPVSERLPKIPKEWEVTVEDDDGNRWVSLSMYEPYSHIKYKWEYESYHPNTRVIAWREKPTPYAPEEK